MLRIYISSTYNDLIAERSVVKEAILSLGHFPLGMEEYSASDQRPLDRCLADVRSCQAYVGIIAWRYGFCPDGSQLSITNLEFKEAADHKIPAFVFVLKDDASWPRNFIPDEDQPRVKAFRKQLENEKLVAFFRNKDELATKVTTSLASVSAVAANPAATAAVEIPPLLPYLCDRSEQERALTGLVERAMENPTRAIVCLVHGDETEAHDKFLERLQKYTLPKLLSSGSERPNVQEYLIPWPEGVRDEDTLHKELLRGLSSAVVETFRAGKEEVNARVAQALGPVALHTHTLSEHWEQQGVEPLGMFLRFWEQWPELSVGQQLFVFLFIKYQGRRNSGLLKWLGYANINGQLREMMKSYDPAAYPRINSLPLPELQGATQGETENWARSNETRRFCDEDALLRAVRDYYAEWASNEKARTLPVRIPTEQLMAKLKEMMSRTQLARERAL